VNRNLQLKIGGLVTVLVALVFVGVWYSGRRLVQRFLKDDVYFTQGERKEVSYCFVKDGQIRRMTSVAWRRGFGAIAVRLASGPEQDCNRSFAPIKQEVLVSLCDSVRKVAWPTLQSDQPAPQDDFCYFYCADGTNQSTFLVSSRKLQEKERYKQVLDLVDRVASNIVFQDGITGSFPNEWHVKVRAAARSGSSPFVGP